MNPRLITYSSAAIALLGFSRDGKSQINYHDFSPDLVGIADPDGVSDAGYTGNYDVYFDLDGNGTNDAEFKMNEWSNFGSGFTASGVFASIFAEQASFQFAGESIAIPFLCCGLTFNNYSVYRFDQGELISALEFGTPDFAIPAGGGFYFAYREGVSGGGLYVNGGQWGEPLVANSYIAFKKTIAGNNNYGWIRLRTERTPYIAGVAGSMYFKITLMDFAFNHTINDPLYAGEGLPECVVPVGYDPLLITTTTAKLKWSPVYAADNYQIYYRPVGAIPWQKINASTNQKKLTGLACNTNYQWKVRSKCDATTTLFSPLYSFTTASCRLEPLNQDVLLNVSPNPVTGKLNIDVSEIGSEYYSVIITNITGKVYREFSTESADDILQADVSKLPAGIYFMTITSNGFRQTLKFVKQ